MKNDISHNNKDILMKALNQLYENKSLAVYGLDIPPIKRMLNTNFPAVIAKELRCDGAFLLVDDTLYIQEYESSIDAENDFWKYNQYAYFGIKQLKSEGVKVKRVIIGVIYTGDIINAPSVWDMGAIKIEVKQVFLSKLDTDSIFINLKNKINLGEMLSDEEMLNFIILPLTQPQIDKKQKLIENAVDLAKQIKDDHQQIFAIAGILTASDKFIDKNYSNSIKEWMKMTKVAQLFEEEKIEAVQQARTDSKKQFARMMLLDGEDRLKIMKCTELSGSEINEIQASIDT